jgi:hypothetical protein
VHLLSAFDTVSLLKYCTVSRRFHHIILRIIHFRLLLAAAAPEYKLILEAYHPTKRYTDPYLFCAYLGTDGLSSKHEGEGSLYHDCQTESGRFAKLGSLYSRFRPERPGVEGTIPVRRVAGLTPNSAGAGNPTQPIYANAGDGGKSKITHTINLDADELFGQFCSYASLVRLGPRRGVFLSTVPLVEPKQGWMRVWRYWLVARARELAAHGDASQPSGLSRTFTDLRPDIGSDRGVLWTDEKHNVGLRFAVRCTEPRFYEGEDDLDDIPLAFEVEVKGQSAFKNALQATVTLTCIPELVVRTTHLMLAVEASMQGKGSPSGRTLIFGNFAVAGQAQNAAAAEAVQ